MYENSYYSEELHGPFEFFDAGDFELEDGGCVRGLKLAYAIHGELNAAKDNAVLMPSWYSGTSKIMEDLFVGAGRALDPARHCIIIVNQIGNGISSSPHNTPAPYNMAKFPHVRIGDDVRAQHKLVTEHLGVTELALVVGGSMGAQQTFDWAVRFPDMVKRAAAIAGYAKNTDHNFIFGQTLFDAITSDPAWNGGWYKSNEDVHEGLRRHARLVAVMGWSTEFFRREAWRGLGFTSLDDFQTGFTEAYFTPMDPNDLLCTLWKWQRGDVSRITGGDLGAALGRIKAKTYVMPIDTDMFFVPGDCEREQQLIPGSEFHVLHSISGHLGLYGIEPEFYQSVDAHLNKLLEFDV